MRMGTKGQGHKHNAPPTKANNWATLGGRRCETSPPTREQPRHELLAAPSATQLKNAFANDAGGGYEPNWLTRSYGAPEANEQHMLQCTTRHNATPRAQSPRESHPGCANPQSVAAHTLGASCLRPLSWANGTCNTSTMWTHFPNLASHGGQHIKLGRSHAPQPCDEYERRSCYPPNPRLPKREATTGSPSTEA